jgi:hypothetical protein
MINKLISLISSLGCLLFVIWSAAGFGWQLFVGFLLLVSLKVFTFLVAGEIFSNSLCGLNSEKFNQLFEQKFDQYLEEHDLKEEDLTGKEKSNIVFYLMQSDPDIQEIIYKNEKFSTLET